MVYRDGERSLMVVGVDLDHLFQPQPLRHCFAHRRADQALGICRHKVDILSGGKLGGTNHVAFVFAVGVIDGDDDAAGAQFIQRLFDRAILLFHMDCPPFIVLEPVLGQKFHSDAA